MPSCGRGKHSGNRFFPFLKRSTENSLVTSYKSYVNAAFKVNFDFSKLENNQHGKLLLEFEQHLAYKNDFYFFPSTLWQFQALNNSDNYKVLADESLATFLGSEHSYDGEVIQSLYLTASQNLKNRGVSKKITHLLSEYLYTDELFDDGICNDIDVLLENKALFLASKETGDLAYSSIAVENSELIYKRFFRTDHLIMKVLFEDVLNENIELLSEEDFYNLAVGAYGLLSTFEATGNHEYLELCIKISSLFNKIYDTDENSIESVIRIKTQKKISPLVQSIMCCAQMELSKNASVTFTSISENIYNQLLRIVEQDLKNNDKVVEMTNTSFRLFYYLFEFELGKKEMLS